MRVRAHLMLPGCQTVVLFELRFGYICEFCRRHCGGVHGSRLVPWLFGRHRQLGEVIHGRVSQLGDYAGRPAGRPRDLADNLGGHASGSRRGSRGFFFAGSEENIDAIYSEEGRMDNGHHSRLPDVRGHTLETILYDMDVRSD